MNPQPKEANPSFFKVLIGNFSDKLRIPPAFAKKYKKSIPKTSLLKTRGAGKLFVVSVISNEEGCFFGRGWHKFVEDNQLKVGEFLVFHFLGGSKFEVTIYDNTACEKILKETGGIQEQRRIVQESREEAEHVYFEYVLKTCQYGSHIVMPETFGRETGLMRKKMTVFKDPSGRVWSIGIRVSGTGKGREISFSGGEMSEFFAANGLVAGDKCIFHFRNGMDNAIHVEIPHKVVEEQRRIVQETREEAERVYFEHVLKTCQYGSHIVMPETFGRETGLMRKKMTVFKDPSGRVWSIGIRVSGTGKGREISFSGGEMSEFFTANGLVAGDKCIFHFRNGMHNAIHVEILHKVVEVANL